MSKLVAGTRKSRLARIQTGMVGSALKAAHAGLEIEEKTIVTKGDRILDAPLAKIGDKGLFTREIEQQLLDGNIDYAVHSYKDLPTELPGGLVIGAVLEREKSHDVLISTPGSTIESLPSGARVGTGSLRRVAMLLHARPDLKPMDLRGNVDTRIDKLDAGNYDAIILAAAGVIRMGAHARISQDLLSGDWFHAVGQGAIAVEIRENDREAAGFLESLEHPPTRAATDAERAFLYRLEGGCQIPVGVRTSISSGELHLSGLVAGLEGDPFITGDISGPVEQAADLGTELAERLLQQGGQEVLESIRTENT